MIDLETLTKTARLSRIKLSPEDEKRLLTEMELVLTHFKELQAVDTNGVEPMYHAVNMQNIWREDNVDTQNAKKLLEVLHETAEGQLKVPQVV